MCVRSGVITAGFKQTHVVSAGMALELPIQRVLEKGFGSQGQEGGDHGRLSSRHTLCHASVALESHMPSKLVEFGAVPGSEHASANQHTVWVARGP
jgi:hypothetical protein